jgi:hypothetical protein
LDRFASLSNKTAACFVVETVASEEFTKAWIRLRQYSGRVTGFRSAMIAAVLHQSFEFYNDFFDMKKILLSIVIDAHKATPPKIFVRHRQACATGDP